MACPVAVSLFPEPLEGVGLVGGPGGGAWLVVVACMPGLVDGLALGLMASMKSA